METERKALVLAITVIATAGTLATLQSLATEATAMQGHQWIMLLVAVAAGYVAGRLFVAPAKMIGLP
jgi:hypothetical protein